MSGHRRDGRATDVTATTATLGGRVTAGSEPTTYHFEYGPTIDYGAETPTVDAAVPVRPR